VQPLQEGPDPGLKIRIVGVRRQEHTDPPHPLGLLRSRRQRPRERHSGEKRDEVAALHCPTSPVLPTGRIAHLNYGRRLLRCGISIPLMSLMGRLEISAARLLYP
jgi:hypothetical protein